MKKIVITIAFAFFICAAFGQHDALRKKHFNLKNNVAIEGYDPVSYFNGEPLEGKPAYKNTFQGITYLFNSPGNLDKFKANPSRYEPAYGGWCAFAMGDSGEKVKIDPETYKIKDGKLYLFYNFWGNNTLEDWNKNEEKLRHTGDINWKKYVP